MSKITLFSNKMCPYARKANIALRQKQLQFPIIEQDLNNKSEKLKQAYSKAIGRTPGRDGAVPVLVDGQTILTDSQPLVWYVAEKFHHQGNKLIPEDHAERFKMRLFIQDFSKKFGALISKFFWWNKKTEEDKNKQLQEATQFLQKLNNRLVLPYALGQQFTVADILLYTHFQVLGGLQHYTGFVIDKKYEKIQQYISEVQKRESVNGVIQPKESYVTALGKFFV